MTTVIFIRHGEIENPEEVVPFRAVGFPLSEKGKNQINTQAERLVKLDVTAIYSSPILRCQETAGIIADSLSKPLDFARGKQSKSKTTAQVDERLIEVDSPFAEMNEQKFCQMVEKVSLYKIPEQLGKGEGAEAIVARMRSFLDEVLEKLADKTVVAVSHGDPIMLLWCSLMGKNIYSLRGSWPEYLPRSGCYELKFESGELVGQRLVVV